MARHHHSRLVKVTLTQRLIVLYLIIGMVGTSVAVPLSYFQIKSHLERNLVRLQEQTAWRASMTARGYIGELYEHIKAVSFIQSTIDMDLPRQRANLTRLIQNEPLINEVSVVDLTGQELVRVSQDDDSSDKLRNMSTDPCFRESSNEMTCFGPPFYALQAGYMMATTAPIVRDGRVVGAIRAVIRIQPLSRELGEVEVGRTGTVYLVDGQGHLLAHRDLTALGSEFDVSSRPVVARLMEGKKVSALEPDSFYTNAQGSRMVSTGLPLEDLGWGVIATTSLEEFSEPVRSLMLVLVPALVIVTVLGLLAIVFFTQRWLRPLGQLRLATETLAAGDLGHRVSISSRDELQDLGNDFNSMAERLQASLGRFAVLVNAMPNGVTLVNEKGYVTFVNPAAARMGGWTESEMVGHHLLSLAAPVSHQNVRKAATKTRAGEAWSFESTVTHKDGSSIPVLVSVAPLTGGQGENIGALAITTDLTELRKLEQEKAQATKMAALGQLTSVVAHELRNPMGAINNSLYYLRLRLGNSDDKLSWHLGTISRAVVSMSRIVEDLLDYTRPKSPAFESVSLDEVVADALSHSSLPDSIAVERKPGSSLPALRGDAEMLRRVFLNLITNAVQAMPEGGALTVCTKSDGQWQAATIGDTGEGIEKEVQEKLFQPLFTTRAKGTGLGLYICKQIVTQHGGEIRVVSQRGLGTAVTVRLPMTEQGGSHGQ